MFHLMQIYWKVSQKTRISPVVFRSPDVFERRAKSRFRSFLSLIWYISLLIVTVKALLSDTKVAIFSFCIVSQVDPSPSSFSLTNASYFVSPISLVSKKRSATSVGRTFFVKILWTLSCISNVTSSSLKLCLSVVQLVFILAFFDSVCWWCSALFLDWFSSIPKVSQKLLTIFSMSAAVAKYSLRVTSEFAIPLFHE